jgi:NAD(P)-dependent dehydrogenase (short-subunit alcohol dehydrogenase family)
MGRLNGRVALISGSGGAMGAAIAARFAEEGARLVLTDISERRLAAEAAAFDPAATAWVRADARVRHEVVRVVEAGIAKFGRIDILINVVGGIRDKELNRQFLVMTEQRYNDTFELNLKAILHFVQLVAPGMLERAYGKIVNLASINMAGEPGQADYGAAKAAVASLTRTLAMELAPHVNVNCISPATIRTSVLDRMPEAEREYYRNKTLLKRFGEPREIAHAALFLASDEAAYVTGENLCVSGGVSPAL